MKNFEAPFKGDVNSYRRYLFLNYPLRIGMPFIIGTFVFHWVIGFSLTLLAIIYVVTVLVKLPSDVHNVYFTDNEFIVKKGEQEYHEQYAEIKKVLYRTPYSEVGRVTVEFHQSHRKKLTFRLTCSGREKDVAKDLLAYIKERDNNVKVELRI